MDLSLNVSEFLFFWSIVVKHDRKGKNKYNETQETWWKIQKDAVKTETEMKRGSDFNVEYKWYSQWRISHQ